MIIYNSNKTSVLYWIHLKEHTDMFSEGYIGVSKNFNKRINKHFCTLRNNTHENDHLNNAYNLYKEENLRVDKILIGTEDYCYEIEEKLRPDRNIGWNINKGGYKPPDPTGRILSEYTKNKISKSHMGLSYGPHTQEHKLKIKMANTGKKVSEKSILKRVETRKENNINNPEHTYIIIYPNGKEIIIQNLNKFSKENNLHAGHMHEVSHKKLKSHKKFKVIKLSNY